MIPDLRSSTGESTTSEIGFYPGHLEERPTGGTQRTTGLMERHEVVKISMMLSRTNFITPLAGICQPITRLRILRHGVYHVPWSLGDRLRPLPMEK